MSRLVQGPAAAPVKAFLVYKNADDTEGRGPMIFVKGFRTRELAAEYADRQQGVMGRTAKWSEQKHGDWEIREIELLDYAPTEDDEIREAALAKLSPREKSALGLK